MWGINERTHEKALAQCLAHSKCSIRESSCYKCLCSFSLTIQFLQHWQIHDVNSQQHCMMFLNFIHVNSFTLHSNSDKFSDFVENLTINNFWGPNKKNLGPLSSNSLLFHTTITLWLKKCIYYSDFNSWMCVCMIYMLFMPVQLNFTIYYT